MLIQRSCRRSLLLLPLMLCGTGLPAYGAVDQSLEEAIDGVADFIADRVHDSNATVIRVAQFADPFDGRKSYGAEIQRLFQVALRSRELDIADRAEIILEGEFQVSSATQEVSGGEVREIAAMRINYTLRSRSRVIATSETDGFLYVTDPDDVAGGVDFYAETDASEDSLPQEVNHELVERLRDDDPVRTAFIEGNEVFPEQGAGYSIEVLVAELKPDGSAPDASAYSNANVELDDGQAFADIRPGQVYAVRINNHHSHEMAAYVEIDGLSTFEFSEIRDQVNGFWVIPANSNMTIFGWHHDLTSVNTFKVVEDSGVADETLDAGDLDYGDIGTISVRYHRSWLPGDPAPAGEPQERLVRTDQGPPKDDPSRLVERNIGILRGSVSIRYDRR